MGFRMALGFRIRGKYFLLSTKNTTPNLQGYEQVSCKLYIIKLYSIDANLCLFLSSRCLTYLDIKFLA